MSPLWPEHRPRGVTSRQSEAYNDGNKPPFQPAQSTLAQRIVHESINVWNESATWQPFGYRRCVRPIEPEGISKSDLIAAFWSLVTLFRNRCECLLAYRFFLEDGQTDREILESSGLTAQKVLGYEGWDMYTTDGTVRCLCRSQRSAELVGFPVGL